MLRQSVALLVGAVLRLLMHNDSSLLSVVEPGVPVSVNGAGGD